MGETAPATMTLTSLQNVPRPAGGANDAGFDLMAHLDLINNLSLEDSSDQCIPMKIDSLKEIRVVGASAGHRHSLVLDENGILYSFGSGNTGCLGHGDTFSQMYPTCITKFVNER